MSKRLIFLTRAILIIFAFALVALLHRLDAADLEQDIRSLDLIQSVAELDISQAFANGRIYTQARLWLEHPDAGPDVQHLAQQHLAVRQQITDLLTASGIPVETISAVKGQTGLSQDQFRLIEFPTVESLLQAPVVVTTAQGALTANFGATAEANLLGPQALETASQSVDEVIDRFLVLTEPQNLSVAIALQETELPDLAENQAACAAELQSVTLHGGKIAARFEQSPSQFDPSFAVMQMPLMPCSFSEQLAVTTEQVQAPSLYELLGATKDPQIDALRANAELLSRLRSVYGRIKFSLAQQIAAEDFAQAYKSIDIFGFTVSTRRFPFAVLLLSMLVAWGLAWTVELARQSGQRIITGKTEEDVVDILLDMAPLRTVIWVALPLLAVLASLPLFPLSSVELIIVVAGAALCVLLGTVASVRARAL